MAVEDQAKGMSEVLKQAEAGMKLFAGEKEAEPDVPAATAFKEEMDVKIAALEKEAAALTGKDNKKARVEKEKEKTNIKNQKDYIDACKIVKGLAPPNGHFLKAAAAPAKEAAPAVKEEKKDEKKEEKKKDDKPKKAMESAGISPAERKELEDLKQKIIDKKAELKAAGMSGGQQNKNEEVVAMVTRMNELKEKESPGSTTTKDKKETGKKKKLDSAQQAMVEEKQKALDDYVENLRTEFKYSKKDIAADPEYKEMKAEVDKLNK